MAVDERADFILSVVGSVRALAADKRLLCGWRCGVGCAQYEHIGWIVAERDAFFLEGDDDAAA